MRSRAVLFGTAVLLAAAPGAARAEWTLWGSVDGLLDDRVTSLFEDDDGSLWIGTVDGFSHFDGVRWQAFGPQQGIPDEDVLDFVRDHDGRLWVCTGAGLFRSAGSSWIRVTEADGLGAEFAYVAFEDRDGVLWFGTRNGVARFDGRSWQTYGVAERVVDILQDRSGAMWFAHTRGVTRYDGISWRTYTPADGLAAWDVRSMLEDREGALWFGTFESSSFDPLVSRFDGSTWRTYGPADGLQGGSVAGLLQDARGTIWARTSGGAFSFDGAAWKELVFPVARPNLEGMVEDRTGALWFALYNVGIARFDQAGWQTFGAADGLPNTLSSDLLEDRSGHIWATFVYANVGAASFDGSSWTTYTVADGLGHNTVFDVLEDRTGSLWFCTQAGVTRLDGGQFHTFTTAEGAPEGEVKQVLEDRNGSLWFFEGFAFQETGYLYRYKDNIWSFVSAPEPVVAPLAVDSLGGLWVSTVSHVTRSYGLARYDGTGWRSFGPADGLPSTWVSSVLVGADGAVWVGREFGLSRYANGTWTTFGAADGVPEAWVRRFYLDRGGRVWASFNGVELLRYEAGGWTRLRASPEFPTGEVNSIAEDPSGRYWFALDTGIARLEGEEWGAYSVTDGLPEPETFQVLLARRGAVWIRTASSLTHHEPDLVSPSVVVTVAPPRVSAATSQSIGFTTAFRDLRGARFSYSLDDAAWSPWSREGSWFGLLAPGQHMFRVRARDQIGNVSLHPTSVAFEVDPLPPSPRFTSPPSGAGVRDLIAIEGTVTDARFVEYRVRFRAAGTEPGVAPLDTTIASSPTPVAAGTLARYDTRRAPDGDYEVILTVTDSLGLLGTAHLDLEVDNHAPPAERTSPVRVLAAEGGEVFNPLGNARVYFPPRAFRSDVVVAFQARSADELPEMVPDSASAAGLPYFLGWGGVALDKTAILELPVSSGSVATAVDPVLYHLGAAAGSRWEFVGGSRASVGDRWISPITSEGWYVLLSESRASRPPAATAHLAAVRVVPRVYSPAAGSTTGMTIAFTLARPSPVSIHIYSRAGRLVREVARGIPMGSGDNAVTWDGRDSSGEFALDGLYLVTVEASGTRQTSTLAITR